MRRKIPNILSLSRVVISPIFYVLFLSGNLDLIGWSLVLFTVGAITDYFDGWLARKMKVTSAWGKFFDPLADKFLTSSAFLAFVALGIIPLWMVLIVIIRDFGTTFLRIFNFSHKELKTSRTAKLKTTLQMVFIFFVLFVYFIGKSEIGSAHAANWILSSPYIYLSMLGLTALTVWSLIEYIWVMFQSGD